ncbi:MAG: hypothetical protein L7H07_02830 [Candidatus Nanopusillus sp.]|nr:hypothetical protein [Candidatus Nanopusillus sp.]
MYPEIEITGKALKRLIFGSEKPDVLSNVKGVLSVDSSNLSFLSCSDMEIRLLPIYEGRVNRKINFASKVFNKLLFLNNDEKYIIRFDPPLMLVYDKKGEIIAEIEGRMF